LATGVEGLATGSYHYDPSAHTLVQISQRCPSDAVMTQDIEGECSCLLLLGGVWSRVISKYGEVCRL
jgi:hypothetical protein